jgi:hypothetical protein
MAWSGSVTTTATIMSRLPTESTRRPALWLATAGLLALVPKCLLCVGVYLGLGAALGLGGREICGVTPGWTWPTWLAVIGAVAGIGAWFAIPRRQG